MMQYKIIAIKSMAMKMTYIMVLCSKIMHRLLFTLACSRSILFSKVRKASSTCPVDCSDFRYVSEESGSKSMIDTVEVDEPNKAFIFHTMSGSEYLCPFEDIRWTDRFAEFSKDNLERLKVVPHFVDEAIKLAHEKESSFVTWLEKEIFNGDLFIEIGVGGILNVHFKYEDKVHRLSSQRHMGMFKDSYLYQLSGIVDFRHYEFIGGSVNTYHMSDSIKRLVVNNIGCRPVTIDNIIYKHGVNVTRVTEENHPEGLISPDAFNGKSLLSDFMEGVDLLD